MQRDGELFSNGEVFFLSQSSQILQKLFAHCFELTEGLRHTDITEAFQLKKGVGCWVLGVDD